MHKLQEFFIDKEMKKQVFDHITAYAKERLVEAAGKQEQTDWFRPLIEVLNDSDKALDQMFETPKTVKPNSPK